MWSNSSRSTVTPTVGADQSEGPERPRQVNINMAMDWTEIRKGMVASGQIDEAKSVEHQRRMLAEVRAHRLSEIRKLQHVTQVELAKAMDVDQSRVSRLEKGKLDATELGTVKKYVEALGGELRLVADFGAAGIVPIGDAVVPDDVTALVDARRGSKVPAARSKSGVAAKKL